MISIVEKVNGKGIKNSKSKNNILPATKSHVNNSKDIIGILNKPTPVSEQLSMTNILSALVFGFFFKSLCSNTTFEVMMANAVNIMYICRIKRSKE